jgi:hypothetical protein
LPTPSFLPSHRSRHLRSLTFIGFHKSPFESRTAFGREQLFVTTNKQSQFGLNNMVVRFRMSIYPEKQTQDAQVSFHSQKQFGIHIFEEHCSHSVLITESALRFYCNVATWFEPVNAKDVVAVVTPLEEGLRRVQGTAK